MSILENHIIYIYIQLQIISKSNLINSTTYINYYKSFNTYI